MKRTLWILTVVGISASVVSVALAGDFSREAIGKYGAQELLLPVGARGIAMGEAVTAVADDATAIHWNPAGLAYVPTGSASFMHAVYLADTSYDYAAYAHRIGERGVIAAAGQFYDFGKIDRRDVSNVDLGDFHPKSSIFSLAFAHNVHELEEGGEISAGVTAKLLRSKIVSSADAYAVDFGFSVKPPGDVPSKLALVVQNLGSGQKFDVDRERLPFQMVGGLAFYPGKWTLALDGVAPRGNDPYAAGGIEYTRGWTRTLTGSLRAGYNTRTLKSGPDGMTGVSFGLGVVLAGLSFDYAVVPFGDLGVAHQMSINYNLPTFEED